MKLHSVQIQKLYGRFSYSLSFDNSDDISIITAPNGFGKTAVISIINSILNKRIEHLKKYAFEHVSLTFSDASTITVERTIITDSDLFDATDASYIIETRRSEAPERWSFNIDEFFKRSTRPIERYIPYLHRTAEGFFDTINDDFISYTQVIERYGDELPAAFRSDNKETPIFDDLVGKIDCHLIATQRLIKNSPRDPRKGRQGTENTSVVDSNAVDLASRIEAATRAYAATAQRLDQTFPERVLQQLPADAPAHLEISKRLDDLEERRERLSKFGLVERTEANLLGYQPSLQDTAVRNILALYADDSESKLKTFDTLYTKIDLFTRICNEHFSFKRLNVNSVDGMKIEDDRGLPIPLRSLSSGEQHILVLIYDLLFKVSENSLILVDEPELSLHVAWQKRFIADLEKIQVIQPMSIIVATHSPQIINDRWDLEIPLEDQQ
jgi:predicted ATP-binding protein involved in virulence